MDKVKQAALVAGFFGAGVLTASQLQAQPAKPALTVNTVKLSRHQLPDAGSEWDVNACGDAVTVKDGFSKVESTCVRETLPDSAVSPLIQRLSGMPVK